MKSTYKLFGTIWDGIDPGKRNHEGLIITDCEDRSAVILFTTLLSANRCEDIEKAVADLKESDFWTIIIDYWCDRNSCIASFLKMRLCQMMTYFEEVYGKRTRCRLISDS